MSGKMGIWTLVSARSLMTAALLGTLFLLSGSTCKMSTEPEGEFELVVRNYTDYELDIYVDGDYAGRAYANDETFLGKFDRNKTTHLEAKYKGRVIADETTDTSKTKRFTWTFHS